MAQINEVVLDGVPQLETLIAENRSLEVSEKPRRLWEDSGDYTFFLIAWDARPKVFSLTRVFIDELRRRKGLRAYGVPATALGKTRRSKINQITTSVSAFAPRQLVIAKPEAA